MSMITAEDEHDLIVSYGMQTEHDQNFPNCKEVHQWVDGDYEHDQEMDLSI